MSFENILQDIVDACPGCEGLALMGSDGIPIASCASRGADPDEVAERVTTLGVEFGRILEEARKAAHSVEGGSLEELVVRMGRGQVVLRAVDRETTLVMVLGAQANAGKGRFLLRRHLLAVRDCL